jgi:outer membrane protein assembly factor BamB
MNTVSALRMTPWLLAVVGAALVAHWMISARPATAVSPRVPLPQNRTAITAPTVDLKGFFRAGDGVAGASGAAWPGFRGAARDNINTEDVRLARRWSGAQPRGQWQIEVGEGYAGPVVVAGRVYLLDYDEESNCDILRCLSSADGREVWRRGYHVEIGRNHGISRTVCAIGAGFVVSIGPKCHVLCADAITGNFKWGIDLAREFGTSVPQWYTGQNPLIDNGRAILAPGGQAMLISVELASGRIAWRTSDPDGWQMTHSSVVPVRLEGEELYLYCSTGGLVGVWADDGSLAFELPEWKVRMATVPSPLPLPGDRVLLTGGYGAGAMMIKLSRDGRKVKPTILFRLPPEVFGAEQHTPIFYNGFIYGILPVSSQLACLSLDGKQLWASGGKAKFGLGPFLIADGLLIVLSDTGTLNLVQPTPDAFKLIGQAKIFDHAHEAWGPMAISGGFLYARDLTRLACFDLREAAHD